MGLNTVNAKNLNPLNVRFFENNTKYMAYSQDFELACIISVLLQLKAKNPFNQYR